jgi:hypothetical protein
MVVDNRTPNICTQCGREMDKDWSFCAFCGSISQSINQLPKISREYTETPMPSKEFLQGKFRSLEPEKVMKTIQRRKKKRRIVSLSLLYFTVFFLIGTGIFWILSLVGIVASVWAAIFGAVFAVLGVLFSFFQWVIPQISESSRNSTSSN